MNTLLNSILQRLGELFDPASLGAMAAEWLGDLIVGLLVFGAFYLAWLVVRQLLRPALRRGRVDATTTSFVETALKTLVLAVGLITALDAAGIQTSAVLASLGIAGLTIGFAARDALSNLISGILIFVDRPFIIGDLVEIENHYGRVDRITLRSTRVITRDGKMLAVPNTEMINKTVASYTNFPHLRLDVAVTVAVTEDLSRVRQILLGLVESDPDYLDDPPPRVVVTQLNDYNVALELQAWIGDEREHVEHRYALRESIFNALNAAGVSMPYETLQLAPFDVRLAGQGGSAQ